MTISDFLWHLPPSYCPISSIWPPYPPPSWRRRLWIAPYTYKFQLNTTTIFQCVKNSPSPNRTSPHYESKENICLSRTTSLVIFVEVTGTTRTKDISIAYKNRSSLYITRFLGWKGYPRIMLPFQTELE